MDTKRKTLVFGNGLGMALNPKVFSLDYAIGAVWGDQNILSNDAKDLIRACLPRNGSDRPHGESDLDTLQLSLSACEFLLGIPNRGCHWLSNDGQKFPVAVKRFIYQTAYVFHYSDIDLPSSFVDPLVEFIRDSESHIATVNYDKLLYNAMLRERILSGYDGCLIDGFLSSGFQGQNMERKFGKSFGYYLHLHGSPLFINDNGAIRKLRQDDMPQFEINGRSHVVLTHVSHKTTVISASDVLMTYWDYFAKSIKESIEIVVIEYSGLDWHLNKTIENHVNGKKIRVIEWNQSGKYDERRRFWRGNFGQDVELIHEESILNFTNWA